MRSPVDISSGECYFWGHSKQKKRKRGKKKGKGKLSLVSSWEQQDRVPNEYPLSSAAGRNDDDDFDEFLTLVSNAVYIIFNWDPHKLLHSYLQ